jgi:hypothetical protein
MAPIAMMKFDGMSSTPTVFDTRKNTAGLCCFRRFRRPFSED